MFEKLRHKGSFIFAASLLFGFVFYVGMRMQAGEVFRGRRGIMGLAADGLNALADMFGAQMAGYGIMGLSLFCGVWVAVWIWRDPMI